MVAEREQGADGLAAVGLAGERDRALQVLARLLRVADAAEDAAEDAVRAAGGARLVQPLGQSERLLRGVDREHVVAGVHVERGRLLVEAHELDARRPVLEQVDPALVVVDRGAALALVPEGRADLAVQIRNPGEVLLGAVVLEAPLPDPDGRVDAAQPQGDVALLLADPGDASRGRGTPRSRAPPCSGRTPRRWSRGRRPRRRRPRGTRAPGPGARRARRGRARPRTPSAAARAKCSAIRPMTPSLRSPARSRMNSRDLDVLPAAHRLGQHRVGDVADQDVLEGVLALAGEPAARRSARACPSPPGWRASGRGRDPPPRRSPPAPPPRRSGRPPRRTAAGGARGGRGSRAGRRAGTARCSGSASASPVSSSSRRFTISSANSGLPPERSATCGTTSAVPLSRARASARRPAPASRSR